MDLLVNVLFYMICFFGVWFIGEGVYNFVKSRVRTRP